MKTCNRRTALFIWLIFLSLFSTIVIHETVWATARNSVGLDFSALLNESIKTDGSLEDGLQIVAGKNTWETLPENHAEMLQCVENDSEWNVSHAGFSTVRKVWQYDNPFGEDENYTLRYSGFIYVEESKAGTWQFCTYSNDASEIEIDGQVVASWYGEHKDGGYHGEHSGSITLKEGWHRFVYRYAMGTGKDYSRADFKYPGASGWEEVSTEYLTIKHYPFEEGILLVNKKNTAENHPEDHDFLKNHVDKSSESHVDYFGWDVVDAMNHSGNSHGEDTNYTSYYETYLEVTDETAGAWAFAVNSAGASEIEVDGQVVASWYGDHSAIPGDYSHQGTVTLAKGWHRLIMRHETLSENGVSEAYFKKPSATEWRLISKANLTLKTYAADIDRDGIHNDLEAILGTDMENRDSDFESLNDYAEVALGSDPLNPDTNNDGLPDTAEVLDKNRDPDGDGEDNLWDRDNDGDGVTDGIDTSPFARTEVKEEFHFEVATGGNSTYLDFQLRTANPMNLMLFGKNYDWPYDTQGQMQDRDNSREDVQLIPMLELTANLLPDQENVKENGINVTTDGKVRAFDGDYTHNDGMGVGNVCGDDEKEIIRADDKSHKITVKTSTGALIREFNSVYGSGDRLLVADLIKDDKDEIIVLNDADASVYIYSGEGHLLMKSREDFSTEIGIAVGDVFGDSKEEIVFGYQVSGHIHVITFFKGSSGFDSYRYAIDENDLYSEDDGLGLSDVDGDGKCEILVAQSGPDRLHIHEFYESGGQWSNSRKVNEFTFDFDPHDGLMGSDMLVSDDPDSPRYGEEILLIKPDGHIRVYTEAGPDEEDRLEDTGYTEFDGYTAEDLVGDDKKEIVIVSDTTGVVNIYNTIDQKAYVPLAPVQENGVTVAFQGRMIYTAAGKPVTLTASARLVWFVVGKTDSEEDPSANEPTVLAKYRDDFFLTGFSATEYDKVSASILHKDDRDEVSNAYMLMQYHFLYGDETLSTMPDLLNDKGVDVTMDSADFEHEYTAEKWVSETLKDTVLPGLPDGKFPVAFGMDTRYAAYDLAGFAGSDALAAGDTFKADLASKEKATSRTIKMNWYDTTLDTISPMEISEIHSAFTGWGYTEHEVDMAIANVAIATAGEESAGDHYSPLKRDGVGILYKGGTFAANAFMISVGGNHLVKATKFRLQDGKIFKAYQFKTSWMKSYKMAKSGGMFAKFGKFAGKISKFAKIGGGLTAVAFAAYTFYSVADASGWSSAGILAGALYAGMQGVYFMALAMISTTVPGGPVIAGLLIISDIITWAITGKGWSDRVMQWVARKLTEVTKPPKVDLDIEDPTVMIVDYDENGFDLGDRIEFKCRATETIKKKSSTKTSDMKSSYVKPYVKFFDSEAYRNHDYRYEISNDLNDTRRIRVWDIGAWVEPKAADIDFTAQVKISAELKVYYRVCTGDDCDRKSKRKYFRYGDTELVFDVMPGSLEDFTNWSVLKPLDSDNDGIADGEEGFSDTLRVLINRKKSDAAEADVRLQWDGSDFLSTTDQDHTTRFRFEINADGKFNIISRADGHFLRADASGLSMAASSDANCLWDVVPVVDDLYRVINVQLTETNETPWCLVMPEDTAGGVVQVMAASDAPNESLWRIESELTNTNSGRKDTDNDGLPDRFETNLLNTGQILDGMDSDMDDDGLNDKEELNSGTNPLKADSDGDGIDDKDELAGWNIRFSYNNLTLTKTVKSNPGEADSDGDGLSDNEERNASPPLNPMAKDTDGDGIPDNRDDDPFNSPKGTDLDHDHLSDQVEREGWAITVTTEIEGTVTKTVTSDFEDEDTDKDTDDDTLPDREEYKISDPRSNDTDRDGIPDQAEKGYGTDIVHFDTDRDGISDGAELNTYNTDPVVADTDKDGLSDGDEIKIYGTNPLLTDTDDDGLADAVELQNTGTEPDDPDSDDDGLTDGFEIDSSNTDPLVKDSDTDGLFDGAEINTHKTNPLSQDTDGDTLSDFDEVTTWCSFATRLDTDKDGLSDNDEILVYNTSPCDSDDDNDGLKDGEEIAFGCDPKNKDSDGDLIEDGDEVHRYGTDPMSNDTDGDGLTDAMEIGVGGYSGLGLGTNPLEEDTDNDGIPDNLDPDSTKVAIDRVLIIYDAVEDQVDLDDLISALENLVGRVDSGTPDEFDLGSYPYIVMLGEPDENGGPVAKMLWLLTDEETRTGMAEDPCLRFGMSAVEKYTGLPEEPSGSPPSGTIPDPSGEQVDLGLVDSLVVMLNGIHKNDAYRVLSKFVQLKKLYWENFVLQPFTTTNPFTDPITGFTIDGVAETNAQITVTLSGNAGYAAGAIVAYTDMTSTALLRSDNGLDQGEPDVDGDEDVLVDQYIMTAASAYTPTIPLEQVDNPVASLTLRIYYTAFSLDRSLPRDGDIDDMLDIDETTLSVYQWSENRWDKLSTDLPWVSSVIINPEDVNLEETDYEGYVEIVTTRTGLFCLAGKRRPDTTGAGAPVVTDVFPAPDAEAVLLTSDITMTFNEDVVIADSSSILVDGAEIDTIALSADNRTITITTPVRIPGVTYTVYLPANAVEDMAGNPNETELSWAFTSIAPQNIPFANDDTFETFEESDLTGINAMGDNGDGADSDDEGAPLTVTSVNGDDALVGQPVAGTLGGIFTLAADGALTFSPNGEFEYLGGDEIVITQLIYAISNGTDTDNATITVTVKGVNDRPEMTTEQRIFPDIAEDAGDDDWDGGDGDDDETFPMNNVAYRVGELLYQAGDISDVDSAVMGMAVVAADQANGIWQYSSDGLTWSDADSATSDSSGLLLGPDDAIRFVPAQNYYGVEGANLVFKAWDQSEGTSGTKGFDTTAGTSCSSSRATAVITINPLNDPPEICVNEAAVLDPGETVVLSSEQLMACDPDDSGSELTFTLTEGPTGGTLFVDADQSGTGDAGEAISAGDTFTQEDLDAGRLLYTHDGSNIIKDTATLSVADGGEDGAEPDTGKVIRFIIRSDADTDNDGMPDWWEVLYSLDPETDNAENDTDNDGLSDYEEFRNGSDPGSVDSGVGIPVLLAPVDAAENQGMTPVLEVGYADEAISDAHGKTRWQVAIDDTFTTLVFDMTLEEHLTSLTIPDGLLETGTVYYWRARFIDTNEVVWNWSETWSWRTATRFFTDENQNNIPDDQEIFESNFIDLDRDGVHDPDQSGMKCIRVPDQNMFISVKAGNNVLSVDYLALIDPSTLPENPEESLEMLYGMLNARVTLETPGEPGTLIVYLSQRLPVDTVWKRYDTIFGWRDQAGVTTDEQRESITIETDDGSEADTDGAANGIIVNMIGAFSYVGQSAGGGDSSSCFIRTLMGR